MYFIVYANEIYVCVCACVNVIYEYTHMCVCVRECVCICMPFEKALKGIYLFEYTYNFREYPTSMS